MTLCSNEQYSIQNLEKDEQIAIEVLETILHGNPNPKTLVCTTSQSFTFTYEDLMADREQAYKIKKSLNSQNDVLMFSKLRRQILSRTYSKKSRSKKRIEIKSSKADRDLIINKVHELFSDHYRFEKFCDFIQVLNEHKMQDAGQDNTAKQCVLETQKP